MNRNDRLNVVYKNVFDSETTTLLTNLSRVQYTHIWICT